VFVSGRDGFLNALSAADGRVVWRTAYSPTLGSSAAVAGEAIYVVSEIGYLWAFDAAGGSPLWWFDTGAEAAAPPVVFDGTVYVGTGHNFRGEGEGFLFAIGGT
jgi:outer membrane protein assembly factor BamB